MTPRRNQAGGPGDIAAAECRELAADDEPLARPRCHCRRPTLRRAPDFAIIEGDQPGRRRHICLACGGVRWGGPKP